MLFDGTFLSSGDYYEFKSVRPLTNVNIGVSGTICSDYSGRRYFGVAGSRGRVKRIVPYERKHPLSNVIKDVTEATLSPNNIVRNVLDCSHDGNAVVFYEDVDTSGTPPILKFRVHRYSGASWDNGVTCSISNATNAGRAHAALDSEGDFLAVSAPWYYGNPAVVFFGRVATFYWDGSTWLQGPTITGQSGDEIGHSIDISSNYLAFDFRGGTQIWTGTPSTSYTFQQTLPGEYCPRLSKDGDRLYTISKSSFFGGPDVMVVSQWTRSGSSWSLSLQRSTNHEPKDNYWTPDAGPSQSTILDWPRSTLNYNDNVSEVGAFSWVEGLPPNEEEKYVEFEGGGGLSVSSVENSAGAGTGGALIPYPPYVTFDGLTQRRLPEGDQEQLV